MLEHNEIVPKFQAMLADIELETIPYTAGGDLAKPCLAVLLDTADEALCIGGDLVGMRLLDEPQCLDEEAFAELKADVDEILQIMGTASFRPQGNKFIVYFLFIEYKELT